MTLRQYQGLTAHWKKAPPAHIALRRLESLVRLGLGIKEETPEKRERRVPTEEEIRSMVALARGGG